MSIPFNAETLIAAYRRGIFPMAEPSGEIHWFAPDPRATFDLDAFHVPRRLARTIRQGKFEMAVNRDFEGTMRGCAAPGPGRDETWISEPFIRVYSELHRMGLAHSVESYQDGRLVGGLYGVALGGAFMGESMFSRVTDASKVALVYLVERLKKRGFVLLDTQFMTPHLEKFGAAYIPLDEYLFKLEMALDLPRRFDGPPPA